MSERSGVAPWDGAGTVLAVLIPRDDGVGATERYPIRQSGVTIGRGEDNDLVIDDPSVSERHARLALDGGVWTLTDLGSVNGTVIDGAPAAAPLPLATGSTVRFGTVELVFSPHDRWVDSDRPDPASVARTAGLGAELTPAAPERRGLPVPLLIGFAITVLAIIGYLLSQGG